MAEVSSKTNSSTDTAERSSLLATKLLAPRPSPTLVARTRLTRRLNEGLHRKLTLVSAPAGFGKTTLLAEWARSAEQPVAWVSLDESDNDPTRFWTYVVASLQTQQPDLDETVPSLLQSTPRWTTPAAYLGILSEERNRFINSDAQSDTKKEDTRSEKKESATNNRLAGRISGGVRRCERGARVRAVTHSLRERPQGCP